MGKIHTQEASIMTVSTADTGRNTAEPQVRWPHTETETVALARSPRSSGQKATQKP